MSVLNQDFGNDSVGTKHLKRLLLERIFWNKTLNQEFQNLGQGEHSWPLISFTYATGPCFFYIEAMIIVCAKQW